MMESIWQEIRKIAWEGDCYIVPKEPFRQLCEQAGYQVVEDPENFEIHVFSDDSSNGGVI